LHFSGIEKTDFVIGKASQFARDKKIAFGFTFVGDKIEELLKLTREVNRRDKDLTGAVSQAVQHVANLRPIVGKWRVRFAG